MSFFQALFGKSGSKEPEDIDPGAAKTTTDAGLNKASEVWSDRARELHARPKPSSWTESTLVIEEYINPCVSGSSELGWLEAVARDYFPATVPVALSLGCGGGGLERHGIQLGIADKFHGLDLSAGAIELAREEAVKYGIGERIDYQVVNLNELQFEAESYDAVFASQSVHHIESLPHYMEQVHRALKPQGLFIINEFVGPNQFQWTDRQLDLAQKILLSIPEKYRGLIREPGIKQQIIRLTVEQMNEVDPTEAIRSEEIIPELEKKFEIIDRRDFGGTLLHLVLDNIAGNLEEDEEGRQILRDLIAEEKRLLVSGEIDSDFTLLVARKA